MIRIFDSFACYQAFEPAIFESKSGIEPELIHLHAVYLPLGSLTAGNCCVLPNTLPTY